MVTTATAGVNIYSAVGLMVAAALFFHFKSKEDTVTMVIVLLVITAILKALE